MSQEASLYREYQAIDVIRDFSNISDVDQGFSFLITSVHEHLPLALQSLLRTHGSAFNGEYTNVYDQIMQITPKPDGEYSSDLLYGIWSDPNNDYWQEITSNKLDINGYFHEPVISKVGPVMRSVDINARSSAQKDSRIPDYIELFPYHAYNDDVCGKLAYFYDGQATDYKLLLEFDLLPDGDYGNGFITINDRSETIIDFSPDDLWHPDEKQAWHKTNIRGLAVHKAQRGITQLLRAANLL